MKSIVVSSIALLLVTTACQSDNLFAPTGLAGTWQTQSQGLKPAGSYQTTYTFLSDGSFTFDVSDYGLYGQAANKLSAYTRNAGSYEIDGDVLALHVASTSWWDSFYGADSPVHFQVVTPQSGPGDPVHFSISGGVLTLNYMSYPADAPVPTTMVLYRAK
jgi:hypothetical protein